MPMANAEAAGKRYCPSGRPPLAFPSMIRPRHIRVSTWPASPGGPAAAESPSWGGLALLVVVFIGFHGCKNGGSVAPNTEAPAAPTVDAIHGGPTVVHVDDDGKSFDVQRGSTVTFELAGAAGTGFAWVATQVDPLVLVQQGDRTTEASSDRPGAPKVDVYRFTATGLGSTTVAMSLQRAFGSAPPGRVLRVTLNVR
jgi:predicted secreted protein